MCVFVRIGLVNTLSGPSGKALPLRIRPDVPYGSVAGQTARLTACSTVNNGEGTRALEHIVRKYKTTLSMLLFFQILAIKPFFPLIRALFIHRPLFAERVQGTFATPVLFSLGVFLVLRVENASLECRLQFSYVTIK